jgi:hypothetical protein
MKKAIVLLSEPKQKQEGYGNLSRAFWSVLFKLIL